MSAAVAPFAVHHGTAGRLRVAAVSVPGLRSVAAILALEAGQWQEPEGRAGIARLVALSLLRGTHGRDAAAWASALDDLGAVARMDTGGHAALLSGQCLADDLEGYLRLVAEAVLRPVFPEEEVELLRAQTLAALDEEARNTRGVADRAWRELAYPRRHPFNARPLGEPEVVRGATVEELRAYHSRAVLGRGGALVLVGGVATERAIAAAQAAFGDWPAAPAPSDRDVPAASIAAALRREEVVPDKTQSDVILGWLGMPRSDPRFVAARVANMVFAADPFASRAGKIVRDELGLAYYVFSSLSATKGQGPWVVRMGVNPRNVAQAIQITLRELEVVLADGFPEDDLDLAKDKLVGELRVALESPGGIAQMVLEAELFDLGPEHHARYADQLRAVSREEVVAVARAFLPADRYALAVAGPPLPA